MQSEVIKSLKLIRTINEMRAQGVEYKDIDMVLNLPTWFTATGIEKPSFSYELVRHFEYMQR